MVLDTNRKLRVNGALLICAVILDILLSCCRTGSTIRYGSHREHGAFPVRPERASWGFIDTSGRFVIPPQFNSGGEFHNGWATVETFQKEPLARKTFAQISKNGLIDPSAADAQFTQKYSELAIIKSGHKLRFVDSVGAVVNEYSEGLAIIKSGHKIGFVDSVGNIVVEPSYKKAHLFSEGLAAVFNGDKWGYIEKNGTLIIPFKFKMAGDFHDGLAWVQNDPSSKEVIFIDRKGNQRLRFSDVDKASNFQGGISCLSQSNNSVAAINEKGQVLFRVENTSDIGEFHCGLCYASKIINGQKLYGYLNTTGDWHIKPQFYKADNFSEQLAAVCIYDAKKVKIFEKELQDFYGSNAPAYSN